MKTVRIVTRPKKPRRLTCEEAFGSSSSWYKDMRRAEYHENRGVLRSIYNWGLAWSLFYLVIGYLWAATVIMAIAALAMVGIFILRYHYRKWVKENG